MNKLVFSFVCLAGLLIPSQAQIVLKEPLSTRQTYYKIDARLDIKERIVKGEMEAFWVNKSSDIVPDIQLHMYLNAFRSNKSTMFKEGHGSPGSTKSDFGWITIKSMTDKSGTDLTRSMNYISPDDGNPEDMTVLKVNLPDPARPGDTVFLNISFESKLPSKIIRTGYYEDFYFVAQWFPKFGVYEPAGMRFAVKGGWNCHQFHSNSEFYSNHSVYDVNITLPKEYVVGTGGMLLNETVNADSTKTLTYRAEDIVDFAWTAWPGYAVYTDQWKHVKIALLLPKERAEQVERQFTAVKHALDYLTEHVGSYPWPHLTFVDPPGKGGGSGGMEYTTLFTSSSAYKIPEYFHLPEMVTVHEFGHAYFMGILASNEFEEPWLDEGVNSYWEQRIIDHYYGENSGVIDHPLLKVSDESVGRLSYVMSANKHTVSNAEFSWNYAHGTYGMMSYMKSATWLYTLMGIVGEETMDEIFIEYYREWAFRHPSGKDFITVVNKVVTKIHGNKFGPDMNWFFDQTLYGTGLCDYKVSAFFNSRINSYEGIVTGGDSLSVLNSDIKKDTLYKSVAQFERIGEVKLPVDILIHFNNGDQVNETWDGISRFKDFEYTGARKIDWVKIDPENKITMDVNFINNSMTSKPDRKQVRLFTNKLVSFMQFFLQFISL